MAANRYSFTTHWHVAAPPDLVSAIHLGREIALQTRGWLPYTRCRGEESLAREIERRRGQPQ